MANIKLVCAVCRVDFFVTPGRKDTAKYCSRQCSDKAPRKRNEVRCRECGQLFPLKASSAGRAKYWGNFCSKHCISAFRRRASTGESNPNFRGRNFDQDGYRIYTPAASLGLGLGRIKIHHAVALTSVSLKKVPAGMHVHHRDCNVLNNEPSNLSFMTASDHKWLHQQFGVATLGAMMRGDIDVSVVARWSDDPIRAESLLLVDVSTQGVLMEYFRRKRVDTDMGQVASIKGVQVSFIEAGELSDTQRGSGGFGSTGA